MAVMMLRTGDDNINVGDIYIFYHVIWLARLVQRLTSLSEEAMLLFPGK